MKSLVSSLKKLKKLKSKIRQPKPEPTAEGRVALSNSPKMPFVPKVPQPQQQEPSQQPAHPPVTGLSLETLPVEIQTCIIAETTSLQAVRALVHASARFHQIYTRDRVSILKKSLKQTLDGVFMDAHAAYLSQSQAPSSFYFDDYDGNRLTTSTEHVLEGLSLAEATDMASFHLSVVEPLTERYADWTLAALSSSPAAVPLSKSEKVRIQRAMYRLQILCNLQIRDADRMLRILTSFPPWEVEQILCVHAFAREKYTSVFIASAWDLNQDDNPKYSHIGITEVNESLLLYRVGCELIPLSPRLVCT